MKGLEELPSLDEQRRHAALCLAVELRKAFVTPATVILEMAAEFEAYLRGE